MDEIMDAKSNSSDLLKAQAHILSHIFNFVNSMSLKCAVELGIPDIIHKHGKPITISELNSALSIHPKKVQCIPRLMHILIHSGFFAPTKMKSSEEQEEEGYILTNSCQLLLKDNPFNLIPFLQFSLDQILTEPWHHISDWLHTEDPSPFETAHGKSLWGYAHQNPMLNKLSNEGMESDTRLVSRVLMDQGKEVFKGLDSIVDVGGGTGTMAKAIAEKFPRIQCTVLDLPHVVAGLNGTWNLKFVAGDMFENIPPADAVLLKGILHNWKDEECLKILEKCKEAIKGRKGGKLIIIDIVKNEAIETQLFFDMVMMVLFDAKERTEKEWAKLFFDAGFSDYKIIPILGLRSVIEVYP